MLGSSSCAGIVKLCWRAKLGDGWGVAQCSLFLSPSKDVFGGVASLEDLALTDDAVLFGLFKPPEDEVFHLQNYSSVSHEKVTFKINPKNCLILTRTVS